MASSKQKNGLTYDNTETLGDLVNKSTTGDGIPDWEKRLYGLDPTKKENVPGVPDSVTIAKLESQNQIGQIEQGLPSPSGTVNLTKTDQFSQDLFATVAAASQNGQIDQTTEDQISSSLADNIQNTPPRKIYLLSDIKISSDNSIKAIQKYSDVLSGIFPKTPNKETVMDVLQKFLADPNNPDTSALAKLDPIIAQTNKIIANMVKTSVPESLSAQHLETINALERLAENVSDIKLYDTDTIVSLSAISQYDQNTTSLQSAVNNLTNAIQEKLNS